jgi:hypothetical protein
MLTPEGTDRTKEEAPSAGVIPTQAIVQCVASGGQGALSQDGQCCKQSPPPTTNCPVVSGA